MKEQRRNGHTVTRNAIRSKAMEWANKNAHVCFGFNATAGWCSRFMKRKDLVLREKTNLAQRMPADLEAKARNFRQHLANITRQHDFILSSIGNMDETPVYFDMPTNKTVESKGAKSVVVKSGGHEKARFTVALACLADGTKLKPMVIFKRKKKPNVAFPSGVFVHFHKSGWMDEDGV
ncbi:hypothetical protein M513_08361, partial [Trichuris suis]